MKDREKLSEEMFYDVCGLILLIIIIFYNSSCINSFWTNGLRELVVVVCVPVETALLWWLFTTAKGLIQKISQKISKKSKHMLQ